MIRLIKQLFCKHDWVAHGAPYIPDENFRVAYHDEVCIKCGKEKDVITKVYNENLAKRTQHKQHTASELAARKRQARIGQRLAELGKEPPG